MSPTSDSIRATLIHALSGQREGVPDYITEFRDGVDAGYFGPGSAVWAVHGSMPTLVAGSRALLMQALHPGALAGVRDWSRYKEDPLGRLAGTVRWIFTVTYGDTVQARAGSAFVSRLHERVVGTYTDAHGERRPYAANDPELLSWVHLAFTDAFLATHEVWGGSIPGGPDAYVREWARAGELMGVPNPPRSKAELRTQLREFADRGDLTGGPQVDEVVRFIRDPPLAASMRTSYRLIFAGAVETIEPRYRRMLKVQPARIGPIRFPTRPATQLALRGAERLLGSQTQGEIAARARLRRLRSVDAASSTRAADAARGLRAVDAASSTRAADAASGSQAAAS